MWQQNVTANLESFIHTTYYLPFQTSEVNPYKFAIFYPTIYNLPFENSEANPRNFATFDHPTIYHLLFEVHPRNLSRLDYA